MPTDDVLGADPEDLQQLAVAVRAAGGTIDGADARIRQRLVSVTWHGSDALELRRSFDFEARSGTRRAVVELRSLADRLEGQALEQRQASGDAPAGPGERPGEVRSSGGSGGEGGASPTLGGAPPVTVLTESRTVGVETGVAPLDGEVKATLVLTVADDGTAQVVVGMDGRIGALSGEASAGLGIGLTNSNELALSFEDEATARRFISEMTNALLPDVEALADVGAPHPLVAALGLGVPALVFGAGTAVLDDIAKDATGVLIANTPTEADHSVGGSADAWGAGALDRFGVDAEIARGAMYHPIDQTWQTHTSLESGVSAQVFDGIELDLAGATSVSTTIGPDGVTEGTLAVEATGGAAAALMGRLGFGGGGPAFDPGGSMRVRFEARLPATDTATQEALNEFNRPIVAPHRVAATLDSMVRDGELTLTLEHRDASDSGRSYGPLEVISTSEVTRVDSVYRRSPGGRWQQVELPGD